MVGKSPVANLWGSEIVAELARRGHWFHMATATRKRIVPVSYEASLTCKLCDTQFKFRHDGAKWTLRDPSDARRAGAPCSKRRIPAAEQARRPGHAAAGA